MSDDSEVIRVGTDSSGRPILMTRFMARWWEGVVRHLGWEPVIVQGAWMSQAGGGASDSSGFHDRAGCLDIRTRDLTEAQRAQVIRVFRLGGAGYWERYPSQNFDFHGHLVLGADIGKTVLAAQQFANYVTGDAGLDGPQRDYHWRPDPIVTVPPDDYMEEPVDAEQEDRIATKAAAKVLATKVKINRGLPTEREVSVEQLLRELRQNA